MHGSRFWRAISCARRCFLTVIGKYVPPLTVASLQTITHSRPETRPIPVTMPAAAIVSPYMPYAANCDSSRNGLPGSSKPRTRSRGRSLPRATWRFRASPPPPGTCEAIFSRRSATSAAIASRLRANVESRVESFVSIAGMDVSRASVARRHGEPCREDDEEAAGCPPEPPQCAKFCTRTLRGHAREPCDRQIDEQAVEIEQGAERDERQRLRRCIGVDELRHEREEEQRDLRIEDVD